MRCEVCNLEFDHCQKHHIQSRCYGGTDNPSNIATLCPNHHTMIHYGEIIIEGRIGSTEGNVLVWRNKGEESITGCSDPQVYIITEI